jgi:hypothetical protein
MDIQSSAGTSVVNVSSSGGTLNWSSGNGNLSTENGGTNISLLRQTAAATNLGANRATIYFRDGTVPGTLKLVVRAGAAGAETTILDNIPQ